MEDGCSRGKFSVTRNIAAGCEPPAAAPDRIAGARVVLNTFLSRTTKRFAARLLADFSIDEGSIQT